MEYTSIISMKRNTSVEAEKYIHATKYGVNEALKRIDLTCVKMTAYWTMTVQ